MAASSDVHGEGGIPDMAKLAQSLPLETRCLPFSLRQYGGFWLPEWILPGLEAVHTHFEPRASDVFLASFPKSGTTWLKALAFATVNRAEHPPSGEDHPLRRRGVHDCVNFFESTFAVSREGGDVFAQLPSPRVLATHLPYSLLPERIVEDSSDSDCRIVYICRDPKDALVSGWLFTKKMLAAAAATNGGIVEMLPPAPYTMEEALDLFCHGRCVTGPHWHHVLEYWEESRRRPEKVLFLRYEEMLREPACNVKKLAEFMGCPFTDEEESAGVVDAIVDLCSFNQLTNLQVNKTGAMEGRLVARNELFFGKGVAGNWSNHMSPEMAARLDRIVEGALRGSGFTFASFDNSA
ncbi:hypothetical protein E2562_006795 [Oryza meyeriana var. granulata]|uniref:Sulfotransferase n=1 Tax=Oryza meyeriana var. granulata TaxID=110450 RepID=A0A6G1C3P7_9ORYZ|nr:hypothetical protein E2562_006795 [Oryza meyeriana var. granulata]